jgi:membrane protease YdiL (CAAX protease family)
MAAFARAGFPIWASVVISSVLFGAAHLYQGRGGLIGTGILGLLFGAFRAYTGSLLPVAAWHAAVDIVAGIAGPLYLINNNTVTEVRSDL